MRSEFVIYILYVHHTFENEHGWEHFPLVSTVTTIIKMWTWTDFSPLISSVLIEWYEYGIGYWSELMILHESYSVTLFFIMFDEELGFFFNLLEVLLFFVNSSMVEEPHQFGEESENHFLSPIDLFLTEGSKQHTTWWIIWLQTCIPCCLLSKTSQEESSWMSCKRHKHLGWILQVLHFFWMKQNLVLAWA